MKYIIPLLIIILFVPVAFSMSEEYGTFPQENKTNETTDQTNQIKDEVLKTPKIQDIQCPNGFDPEKIENQILCISNSETSKQDISTADFISCETLENSIKVSSNTYTNFLDESTYTKYECKNNLPIKKEFKITEPKRISEEKSESKLTIRTFEKQKSIWDFLSDEKIIFINSYQPHFGSGFFVYQYPEKIKTGTVIQSYGEPENQITAEKESLFFFVDYYPTGAGFAHETDFCLIAEQITCMKANWWPIINGVSWIDFEQTTTSPILNFPIIGGAMEWIWEKIFGKEQVIIEQPKPLPDVPTKPSRRDLKKIDNETADKIEKFILSNPEKEDVENIYAFLINFMGTDQNANEEFSREINTTNSAFEKTIGREKTIYLVPNESYFTESTDGLSTIENVIESAQKIGNKMTCKDRVIILINGHGKPPEEGGGIKNLDNGGFFYPQNLTQYFPECQEPVIYFVISSCFGAQYTDLNSDPKVRAYYSGTGKDIIVYVGWPEPYYGFLSAFAHDFEKYYPKYKNMPDDLMLLTHLSVLEKDEFPESPRGYVKTNSISREIIADLFLKESLCTEIGLKYSNVEDFDAIIKIVFSKKSVPPIKLLLEKQNHCIKALDKLLDALPEVKNGNCQRAISITNEIISSFENFQEVGDLENYYYDWEIEGFKKHNLFDEDKLNELKTELEDVFGQLKNKITDNLSQLKSTISLTCN